MMTHCTICGAKIPGKARFCIKCGAKIEGPPSPEKIPKEKSTGISTPSPSLPRRRKLPVIAIAGAAVLMIAAATVGVFHFFPRGLNGDNYKPCDPSLNFHIEGLSCTLVDGVMQPGTFTGLSLDGRGIPVATKMVEEGGFILTKDFGRIMVRFGNANGGGMQVRLAPGQESKLKDWLDGGGPSVATEGIKVSPMGDQAPAVPVETHSPNSSRGNVRSAAQPVPAHNGAGATELNTPHRTEPVAEETKDHVDANNDLAAAVAAGLVTARFHGNGGSSGDVIELEVAKAARAGSGTLRLTVAPGTRLQSRNDGDQNMVIAGVRGRAINERSYEPDSAIEVGGGGSSTYFLEGYCMDFEKKNPSKATTFSIASPDPVLASILAGADRLSTNAKQAAVWIYTDHATHRQVNEKFPVSDADWAEAEAVVKKCRALRGR